MALAAFAALLVVATEAPTAVAQQQAITPRGAASSAVYASESTTTLTLSVPAGAQAGDVLVASLGFGSSVATAQPALAPPAGWALVSRVDQDVVGSLAVYWHVYAAGESAYTWTASVLVGGAAFLSAYGGVDTTNPIDVSAGQATIKSVAISAPSVATTAANDVLVASYFGYRSNGGPVTWTPPPGMAEIGDATNQRSRSGCLDYAVQSAAGPSGVKTANASAREDYGIAVLTALRPAPAGPDTTPPVISGVGAGSVSSSGATVSWTTDEASDSMVEYGTTNAYGSSTTPDPALVLAHSQVLSGLAPSTTYHYRVDSRDAAGNLATSPDATFTTAAPPDTTPPAITNVGSGSVTASGATVTWTTDEPADSQVEYGTTTSYGLATTRDVTMVLAHSQTLTGLAPATPYHFRVKSRDAAGNLATSADSTFTTDGVPDTTPPVISGAGAGSITSSSATVTWTTDEGSDSQVEYGLTSAYGSSTPVDPSMVTAHSVPVSNLPLPSNPVPAYDHVFVIVMENYSYSDILNSPQAGYIQSLRSQGATAGSYFAIEHPSLPNYAELTSGQSFPNAGTNCSPSTTCQSTAINIGDRVEAAGKSWKAYEESMGAPCRTTDSGLYTTRHDPFVYYTDITGNASRCQAHVVDYSNLATDLASAGTTPDYVFITPNACNDMHDCPIANGDGWLASNVPTILGSPAFTTQRSLLILVWDEGDNSPSNQVAMIAVGYGVKTGYTSSTVYNHYSLLRTVEDGWGLATMTGNDGGATAMTDLFTASSTASTTYHYRVKSRDAAGNLAVSGDLTFTTAPASDTTPPVIGGVAAGSLSTSGATVRWATDQAADSQLDYGPTMSYGSLSPLNPSLVVSHTASLSGLSAGTTYHYRARSRDAAGNLAVSADYTFTTFASASGPVPIIVDTDIFSDADDVGALATAFGLQIRGEATVIAIGVNTRTSRPAVATNSWKCAAAVAQFYNSASVPIGTDMPNNGTAVNTVDFVGPCAQLASPSTPAPDTAVNVFRRALAAQPNGSVVMVATGYEENLSNLLNSPPDSISALSGRDLISQKVKTLVVMGGRYPSGPGETNFAGNPAAAQDVSANWPTRIVYSGTEIGDAVHTGNTISSVHPANSPVRVAYEAFVGANNWIYSYDLAAAYHAVRPGDSLLVESASGTNAINGSGGNVFTTGAGNRYYVSLTNATSLDSSIEALLDTLPPPPADTTPPVMSGVAAGSVSTSSGTISWTTDETSDSQVDYGLSSAYGLSSPVYSAAVVNHSVTLTGLAAGTTYHYRVKSRDGSGNLGVSGDFTFTTSSSAPPGPSDNFDSNTIDASKWTVTLNGSTVAAANQELEITHPSSTSWTKGTIQCASAFNATGKSVQLQVKRAANNGLGGVSYGETSVFLQVDSTHYVYFFIAGGALTAWVNNGSGEVNLTPSWPRYSSTTMQWLRFRESGGTMFWEYASGATAPGTWTLLASAADPFPMTGVVLKIGAGSNVPAVDMAQFDNVSTS